MENETTGTVATRRTSRITSYWSVLPGALLLLTLWSLPAWAQDMSMKLGINRASFSGLTYTHDDGTTEYSNSEALVGNELFFEYVMAERFSLEIDASVSPLSRNYRLEEGGVIASDNVTETFNYVTYGANLYFTKAQRKGLKVLVGVATGTASIDHEFEGGTLGAKTTSNDATLAIFKLGMDWVTTMAGLRLQYQLVEGKVSNTTQITGVKQTMDINGGLIVLGVFAFF